MISSLSLPPIPRLDRFSYKSKDHINLINNLANFDGVHYIFIAKNGYQRSESAFFPLYPFLLQTLNPIFLYNYPLTGFFISLFSTVAGVIFFTKLLDLTIKDFGQKIWSVLFLILFPTSFFFFCVYSESLFFFLAVTSIYFFFKEQYSSSFLLGALAALTRFMGLFLIIPFLMMLILNKPKKTTLPALFAAFSPALGFFSYCFYLYQTTGDFLNYFHSQISFNNQRTLQIIFLPQVLFRYLKIFATSSLNFQYFVAGLEFLTFIFVLAVLILGLLKKSQFKANYPGLFYGLWLFSFINLILPTFTGTLLSIPRITLLSVSFFIILASIKDLKLKIILGTLFLALHTILFAFFSQGYFIS